MNQYLRRAGPLRSFALGALGLALLLLLAPSAHANPPLLVQPPALDSAASNALLEFSSQGHVLGFQAGGFYVSNATYALRVEFVAANPVAPTSDASSESHSEQRGAPPLGRVTYPNQWDGITLTLDSARGGVVSSSYRVEARADPRAIRLRYNTPVTINTDGTLTMAYATGEMSESAPVAWQEKAGERVAVRVGFVRLGEREVGFGLGEYDAGQPLFIDPTLTWNTFLGGGGDDSANAIAVDGSGNIYVAGSSNDSWGLPVRAYTGGDDTFVAKLGSNGVVTWNSFLGGGGSDTGYAIALDGSGNVYVAGESDTTWQGGSSPIRPFTSAVDAFVAKVDSGGALTWNTFVGGGGLDMGRAIAVDANGNIYVAGNSNATWQGGSAPKRAYTNGIDGYAAKLSSTGTLTWNTFLGGNGLDYASAIAVDGSGNVYVAGSSDGGWGSPVRAFSGPLLIMDAFSAKLSSNGDLTWNTFLGGSGNDFAYAITVDGSGNIYLVGTSDTTWQGGSAPVRGYTSGYDAFIAKLLPSGSLTWNTFLGGSGADWGFGVAVDGGGNIYAAGFSTATWQGATAPTRNFTAVSDAFAAQLHSNGVLGWNTFLGGYGDDVGGPIAIGGGGIVYVTGSTSQSWGSPVRPYAGATDGFVARIGEFHLLLPLTLR